MKSPRIVLAVVVLVLTVCAVGLAVVDGPRAAVTPALTAVVGGILLYRLSKHPIAPARWTRRRVTLVAVALVPASVAVIAVMVWVIVVNPDWAIRLVAAGAIAVVPASLVWLVRLARREDQAARDLV